jgi:hypothetical protein
MTGHGGSLGFMAPSCATMAHGAHSLARNTLNESSWLRVSGTGPKAQIARAISTYMLTLWIHRSSVARDRTP